MLRQFLKKSSALAYVALSLVVRADTLDSGWTWTLASCPLAPSVTTGTFTAETTGGFTSSGECGFVNNGFTKYSFTANSGGTLASSTLYGLYTDDLLVVPPTLSGDVVPTYLVSPGCPVAPHTLNWIFVEWGRANRLENTYLLGSATYSPQQGVVITGQYDVSGQVYWAGRVPMSGSCAGGVYASASPNQDMDGSVYFTAEGNGVFRTRAGNATFFFSQYPVALVADLGNRTLPGISFDGRSGANTRTVRVSTSSDGATFTIEPYLNAEAGTIDTSFTDTVVITGVNAPEDGILTGTVTRSGSSTGTGDIACIADKNANGVFRVICTGQSPTDNDYPYNITFVQRAGSGNVTTAGGSFWALTPSGGPATEAVLFQPTGIAVDASGNIFFSDSNNFVIRKVTPGGIITTYAGTGNYGYSGDGGPASNATLGSSLGLALDAGGNLYVANSSNNAVRKISAAGTITTVAGTGAAGYSGDGGPATAATLSGPWSVAVDGSGDLYIADTGNSVVRKVSGGIISTVAGTGVPGFSGDGGQATSAELFAPDYLAVDGAGNLYIAQNDFGTQRIRKVDASGVITTIHTTTSGYLSAFAVDSSGDLFFYDQPLLKKRDHTSGIVTVVAGSILGGTHGDGGPATHASFAWAVPGMAFDASDNLFFTELGSSAVRKIDAGTGILSTIAGAVAANDGTGLNSLNGIAVDATGNLYLPDYGWNTLWKLTPGGAIRAVAGVFDSVGGFTGDGGPAIEAGLKNPMDVIFDSSGGYLIADSSNHVIRRVDSSGNITTIAGTGGSAGYSGDGGPATSALLNNPQGIALDGSGNLYIVDTNNNGIRKVDGSGIITTLAGGGGEFNGPTAVALDASDNLYVADPNNHLVHKIDGVTAVVTTLAGDGTQGYSGDGGPATAAQLNDPIGVAVDGSGNVFISELQNHTLRKVTPGGTITTACGTGASGYAGDGGPASGAKLSSPRRLTFDSAGNLYVADSGNQAVRKITPAGTITTVRGRLPNTYRGDGGPATSATFYQPSGIAFDASGSLFVVDRQNHVVRKIDGAGNISTVVGSGRLGSYSDQAGDGAVATGAGLNYPSDIAFDASGNLYIVNGGTSIISKVDTAGIITTIAGNWTQGYSGDGGPATAAQLNSPWGVAVDSAGDLYFSDSNNHVIRKIDGSGIITTYAGTGSPGYSGDGGPATSATLNIPYGIAFDSSDNLYVAEYSNFVVRKITRATGIITTFAGNGSLGYSGDGGLATSATLGYVSKLAVDSLGNVYVADTYSCVVRRIDTGGIITTVIGNGTCGYSSGGPAAAGPSGSIWGLAFDTGGDLYFSDMLSNTIRRVTP